MTKPKLVPVVHPLYFTAHAHEITVTSTFAYWTDNEQSGFYEIDQETGEVVAPDKEETYEEFAKQIVAVPFGHPLWLYQSILTLSNVVRHPAAEAAAGALLERDASIDYLLGIQLLLEQIYWEE